MVHAQADASDSCLRISMDTKAVVKVGPFSRGGKNRVLTKAADHDFEAKETVTPVGIFLPASDELFLYGVTSKVTSDCLVDQLILWWERVKERFSHIKTLVMNLDNGPENNSRRSQFMLRLLTFAQTYQIHLRLAYYPPYHSKYNPVERCWGILEHHWNGALLDSVDAILTFARTMTWKGTHPVVELVTTTYQSGVTLTKKAMQVVETYVKRRPSLEKWFVDISPPLPTVNMQEALLSPQENSTRHNRVKKPTPTTIKHDPFLPKRPVGRPRTKPERNPNLPKRSPGRPRTRPVRDPLLPKRPPGRPRKVLLSEHLTPMVPVSS